MTTNHGFSKLVLSLGAALTVSVAAGSVARASPIPTTTDEARTFAGSTVAPTTASTPTKGPVSSTDEARALAGSSLPESSISPVISQMVTTTDEARAIAGRGSPAPGRAVASKAGYLGAP